MHGEIAAQAGLQRVLRGVKVRDVMDAEPASVNPNETVADLVNERLMQIMSSSFGDVLELSRLHKVNMRTAAYMLAISRVATVHRLRGIYA